MAETVIKLHVLSAGDRQSSPHVDVMVILSGTSSLFELVNTNTLQGTMNTLPQDSVRAITIDRTTDCLDHVLLFDGDTPTTVSHSLVRSSLI